MLREDPSKVAEEIKNDPKILDIMLSSDDQLQHERNEKIKYMNMTFQMQQQLEELSKKLNVSQGALIGAGVLFLLSQFDSK